jgi:hypothetical protein
MRWAWDVASIGKRGMMGMGCSKHWEKRNAFRDLVGKPEGERQLRKPTRRWEDNIKMDLMETGWGGMDWIHLIQDRDQWRDLLNTVMNLRVPYNVRKFLSS